LISVLSRHQNRESLRITQLQTHCELLFCTLLTISAKYSHVLHLLSRWHNQSARINRCCWQKMNRWILLDEEMFDSISRTSDHEIDW
jgi:hypothetical protein